MPPVKNKLIRRPSAWDTPKLPKQHKHHLLKRFWNPNSFKIKTKSSRRQGVCWWNESADYIGQMSNALPKPIPCFFEPYMSQHTQSLISQLLDKKQHSDKMPSNRHEPFHYTSAETPLKTTLILENCVGDVHISTLGPVYLIHSLLRHEWHIVICVLSLKCRKRNWIVIGNNCCVNLRLKDTLTWPTAIK